MPSGFPQGGKNVTCVTYRTLCLKMSQKYRTSKKEMIFNAKFQISMKESCAKIQIEFFAPKYYFEIIENTKYAKFTFLAKIQILSQCVTHCLTSTRRRSINMNCLNFPNCLESKAIMKQRLILLQMFLLLDKPNIFRTSVSSSKEEDFCASY